MEENNQGFEVQQTEGINNSENVEPKVGEVIGADGFSEKDKEDNKLMAVLSYIGILSLIPYFTAKDSPWVKFHALQGVNLFIFELICIAIGCIPILGWLVSGFMGIVNFVIAIIAIINVCNGEAKELPIINNMKFIKK